MTFQQLDAIHKAKPFKPFVIHMADGREFTIHHPEFLSRSPSGRTIIVYGTDDSFSILDLLLMTELRALPTTRSEEAA